MLGIIMLFIVIGGLIWIGYERGYLKASNKYDPEEMDWWKKQVEESTDELKSEKEKNESLWKQNKALINENELLLNQINGYLSRFGELKLTIAQQHQEEIIQYFKEGLPLNEIAKKIGCGKTTIHRAVKEWGLER